MEKASEHRIRQLDVLRAFAVTFVLLGHWVPEDTLAGRYVVQPFHLAQIGLHLFFVLSGFLIGSILIRNAYTLRENGQESRWKVIKVFFVRRTLRIFPIYYILLFFLLLINYDNIRVFLPWLLTYTTNFYIFKIQHWLGDYSHLWSLAVEEQFYILFPWLIIFIPTRHLTKVIFTFIAIGVLFRICVYIFHIHPMAYNLTPALLDYFGVGALLAYGRINRIDIPKKSLWRITIGMIWIYFLLPFAHFNGKSIISLVLPITPVYFALMIDYCCDAKRGILAELLLCKPLIYIGRISYGIYLFHNFIPSLRIFIFSATKLPLNSVSLNILINFILVICTASLIYWAIEKPIGKFKDAMT